CPPLNLYLSRRLSVIDDSEPDPRQRAGNALDWPNRRFPGRTETAPPNDGDPFGHGHSPRSEFLPAEELTREDHRVADKSRRRFPGGSLPDESGAPPLADGSEPQLEDPMPAGRRIAAITVFFLLMAVIGSGSGAIWYYFGPEWVRDGAQIDETAQTIARLSE